MKKIILSLMFVLFASMAIASVSAVHATSDNWISIDDADSRVFDLVDEGYTPTPEDFELIRAFSFDGYINEVDLDMILSDIIARGSIFD